MSKKEQVLMKSEERLDRAAVAAFFRELAGKLESGTITLTQAGDQLNLVIPEQLVLEIKAEEETKTRGIKHSLEIELSWLPGEGDSSISLG